MDRKIYPKFNNIKVSTKTYTASTNVTFSLENLFNTLPITPYTVIPKKRGRKKKGVVECVNQDVPYGSIITLKYENQLKGTELKPKKKGSYFRNAVTVVLIMDKPINFKICKSGTFQMTGCQSWQHAENCITEIWKHIIDKDNIYEYKNENDKLKAYVIPSMRNIDFDLGFKVDREAFNRYMNKIIDTYCLLETSFGYTGVSVKFPLQKTRCEMNIKIMTYEGDKWNIEEDKYGKYLDTLSEKEKYKKINQQKYNTFLVFHSGKVIFSGLASEFMEDAYYKFIDLVDEGVDEIREKLEI